MNRKDFLKNCVAFGVPLVYSKTIFRNWDIYDPSFNEHLSYDFVKAVDAHAHPYNIHSYPYFINGRLRHLRTIPTITKMKEGGLIASVFAAVGDRFVSNDSSKSLFKDTLDQFKKVKNLEERNQLTLLETKSDFDSIVKNNDLFGCILSIEGGDALEGNISNLNEFYNYGVRLMTLMHKHDNNIGFNQESKSDGPLTAFGSKVVEKMEEIGMIIDVSHSARGTLKSISEISQRPLLDSHTGLLPEGEVNYFPNRSRTWEEMEIIAKSGGVICTMPIAYIIGKHSKTTLADWANEVLLMKTRLGIEHVGLGTDNGGSLPKLVDGWNSISSLPDFVTELLRAGLTKDDITAYTGGNFIRIAKTFLT